MTGRNVPWWRRLALLPALIGALTLAGQAYAGSTTPAREYTAPSVQQATPQPLGSSADDSRAALFDDLAAADDPTLADHSAKGSMSAGELALVIIFMIIFFPIGIILLIVFIAD